MASLSRRLPANVEGPLFVDDTCIDCAACRWIAPASFDEHGDASRVFHQPTSDAERHRALLALIACPTGSIGADQADAALAAARAGFPDCIEGPVHHCGWHARASFGAASYLLVRPEGNVLVDSPRYAPELAARIESLGGARFMFLTHRDDVADHARWRKRLGCERIVHERDAVFAPERALSGDDPIELGADLLVIPTPGHTRGSACLLLRERYLLSGDHLAWSPATRRLTAFRDACWFDWRAQTRSMERLAAHTFEWVLPGHGHPVHLDRAQMASELRRLVRSMANR